MVQAIVKQILNDYRLAWTGHQCVCQGFWLIVLKAAPYICSCSHKSMENWWIQNKLLFWWFCIDLWLVKYFSGSDWFACKLAVHIGMCCPSWQWHRTESSWSPVLTLSVAPLWCGLGFLPNSCGNKAAAKLLPKICPNTMWFVIFNIIQSYQIFVSSIIFSSFIQFFHGFLSWLCEHTFHNILP